MIELIYVPNPIAQGLTILVQEGGLESRDFSPGDGTEGLYVSPLLLDDEPFPGAGQVEITHPGAAMVYLAEKAKSRGSAADFYPEDPNQAFTAEKWVMWQAAKQAFCPPERLPENHDRANRLFECLNTWLAARNFIAGNHYSIADMMCYPWIKNWLGDATSVDGYPKLNQWFREGVGARSAVIKGMAIGAQRPARNRDTDNLLWRATQFSYLPGRPTTRYP